MPRKMIHLVEFQPYDPVGATTRIINFSDHLHDSGALGTASPYYVRIAEGLVFETGIFDGNIPGGTTVTVGSVVLNNADGSLDFLLDYNWDSRAVVVKKGYEGDSYASFETIFTGASLEVLANPETLTIVLRDNSYKISKPLQPTLYLGTGGSEGTIDLKERRKPLCFGLCRNASPVLVDPVLLTAQVHDSAVEAITGVYDKGNPLSFSANYSTYAALVAATIPPGYYATSIETGFLRLGAKPVGVITSDVRGEYYSTATTIAALAENILEDRLGVPASEIDNPSFTTLAGEHPYAYEGVYLPEPDFDGDEFLETLIASVHGFWYVSETGQFTVSQFRFRTPTLSLIEDDFVQISREQSPYPNHTARVNYSKNPTVMSVGDFVIPRETLTGFLSDETIYVDTDAAGNGGVYNYVGVLNTFLSDRVDYNDKRIVVSSYTANSISAVDATIGGYTISKPAGGTTAYDSVSQGTQMVDDYVIWFKQNTTSPFRVGVTTAPNTTTDNANMAFAVEVSNLAVNFSKLGVADGSGAALTTDWIALVREANVVKVYKNSTRDIGTATLLKTFTGTMTGTHYLKTNIFNSSNSFKIVASADPADWMTSTFVNDLGTVQFTEITPVSWLTLLSDGTFTVSDPGTDTASTVLEARIGEYAVRETFTLRKSKEASAKELRVTVSNRRFYFDDDGGEAVAGQSSLITAIPTNVTTPLTFTAFDNIGNAVTLTGSGNSRTLASTDVSLSPLIQWVRVTVTSPDGSTNSTKILIQKGLDSIATVYLGALAASNESIDIFYQNDPPTVAKAGDLWFDTNDGNKQYTRTTSNTWITVQDTAIGTALSAAAGAQATADGKVKTFFGESTPTATAVGDLWYKPSTRVLSRWDGATWSNAVGTYGATVGTDLYTGAGVLITSDEVMNAAVIIGGVNLLVKSGISGTKIAHTPARSGYAIDLAYAGSLVSITTATQVIRANTEYTASVWAYVTSGTSPQQFYFDLFPDTLPQSAAFTTVTTTPVKIAWTFNSGSHADLAACYLRIVRAAGTNGTIRFYDLQFEEGNKATAWTPSPTDIELIRLAGFTGATDATYTNNTGPWAGSTVYKIGDFVQYANSSYIAITNHTSNASFPPGHASNTNFTILAATGLRSETIYIRSNPTPATPTGDTPASWSLTIPPTPTDTALWSSTGMKTGTNVLSGVWSSPVKISGQILRGAYSSAATYYTNDLVTYNGGTYYTLQNDFTNQAPSGTAQANSYWGVQAAPGATAGTGSQTITLTMNSGSVGTTVNLRTLADAAGYTAGDLTLNCNISATYRGPSGGYAIRTGTFPTDKTIAITITVQSGGIVDGGGGPGGSGGSGGPGAPGGDGSDAFYIEHNCSGGLTINSGGTVRAGGGGGGGGGGSTRIFGPAGEETLTTAGGSGGGGGAPNGAGGVAGTGDSIGNGGSAGTTGGGGAGGADPTGGGEAGGAGANYNGTGTTGTTGDGTGTGTVTNYGGGVGGAPGYAVRKNGKTVTVTNNGTMTGTAA